MSMIVNIAQVVSISDETDGLRIKAVSIHDKNINLDEIPYAFPLMPKTFQTVPKIGEAVLLIYSQIDNSNSQRYYIGPIISQPQYMGNAPYNNGIGEGTSVLQGSKVAPLPRISQFAATDGAFPNIEDVALVGRKSEDIILKDNEVNIRCGVRTEANYNGDVDTNGLVGDVIFNSKNPAYIQLKKCEEKGGETYTNIVSDKINLISHNYNSSQAINLTNPSSDSSRTHENLIKESDFEHIMNQLHQIPYGDVLIQVLDLMRRVLLTHTHAFPGLPPVQSDSVLGLNGVNLNDMLSPDIRIS